MADHEDCGHAGQGDMTNDRAGHRGRGAMPNMSKAAKKAITDQAKQDGEDRARERAKGYKGPERRGGGHGVGDTGGPPSSGPTRGNGSFF